MTTVGRNALTEGVRQTRRAATDESQEDIVKRINLVLVRYDEPRKKLGVHHSDGAAPPVLIAEEQLSEYFDLGNKVEVTAEELRNGDQIPMEWKRPEVSDEWLLGRVTAYDRITPIH